MEHQLGKAAGAEPGDAVHRRIRRQASADLFDPLAQRRQKFFPVHLLHATCPEMPAKSFGSVCAQYVMLPAPKRTTKSPGFAMPATTGAKASGDGRKRASRWPADLMRETISSAVTPSTGSSPAA